LEVRPEINSERRRCGTTKVILRQMGTGPDKEVTLKFADAGASALWRR